MTRFIQQMCSSRSKVSAKRVASLFAFLNVLALAWLDTFTIYDVDRHIFDALLMFSATGLGLTVLEKIWDKSNKTTE